MLPRPALFLLLLVAVLSGCRRDGASAPHAHRETAAAEASGPVATLDRMDKRTPLPLLPMMANHQKENMRDHLVAVQEIVVALAAGDYAAVERAAGRIGYSEAMGRVCEHMGAGARQFTEQALAFHRTADRIAVAARARDRARVLTELGATLQTCTGCHATWKQQVVDEAAWSRLTGAEPPTGEHNP